MERHTVSRLIGAPPGYVGFDQGGLLTDAIAKTPHAVLLLDEIEKAHPDVFNVLLQVMDHGKLDRQQRQVDRLPPRHPAHDQQRRRAGSGAAFARLRRAATRPAISASKGSRSPCTSPGREESEGDRAVERMFSPEFRNRLDARIAVPPALARVMGNIVDKFVAELAGQLGAKGITIELTDAARDLLAKKGYDPAFGARPLARVMEDTVKRPLGEELLFGKLENGGTAVVDAEGETIVLRTTARPEAEETGEVLRPADPAKATAAAAAADTAETAS